jgi:hypothetical protein
VKSSIQQTRLGFQLGQTSETITSHSGLALIQELALSLGVVREIDAQLPGPGSNRGYTPEALVMPLVLMFCGGGRAMEEIHVIKQDQGLRDLCGLDRVPSPDAIRTWIRSAGRLKGLKRVNQHLVNQILKHSTETEFTLDTDATYIETEKCSAKDNYKGIKSFSVLLSFLTELDTCVAATYRNGNISPGTGIIQHLKQTFSLLKSQGRRLKYFRSDSAAYNADVLNFCSDKKIIFTITADKDVAVKELIKNVKPGKWLRFFNRRGERTDREYAIRTHCMNNSNESFTLIILRWPNPRYNPQGELFDNQGRKGTNRPGSEQESEEENSPYCYHVIATNDNERPTHEVIHHHNARGDAENYNKEIKSGFGMEYAPSQLLRGNANYFEIALLAYNLVIAFKRLQLEPGWWRKTIQTIRWGLIEIAGKVVRHGRRLWLLVMKHHWGMLSEIRGRLPNVLVPS